jgi:hypothetical protein
MMSVADSDPQHLPTGILLNRNTCWLVLKKIDKITGAETQEHCRPLRCPSLRAKTDLGIRAL